MSEDKSPVCSLGEKHCKPCEGGVLKLERRAAEELLRDLGETWELNDSCTEITRDFRFGDFYKTIAFVNAVAWIANREDHHPDLEVGYRHCRIRYTTHELGGLSENDFICAAKIDALVEN